MTTRINVTIPDALAVLVRERMPGLNVSGVLQAALAELVECSHHVLACTCCGARVEQRALADVVLSRFYAELVWRLQEPVSKCVTAEGAARVMQDVARSWEVSSVETSPLPRPTRSQRARAHAELLEDARATSAEQFVEGVKPRRRAARSA